MDQKYERILIFRCRRKPECPEKTYQGGYGISKPNSHTTTGLLHWWKESVRALTKPPCHWSSVPSWYRTEQALQNPLALLGFELGTYSTTSKNFTSVPLYSSYIISFSGFWIRRFKLILNSKNLLPIPYIACLMHFFTKKSLFNPDLKMVASTPADLHQSDLH